MEIGVTKLVQERLKTTVIEKTADVLPTLLLGYAFGQGEK